MNSPREEVEVRRPALLLALDTPQEAERVFGALTAQGEVTVPMGPTPFATRFGVGVDAFGIRWMVTGTEQA